MSKPGPYCRQIGRWLKGRELSTAALTGTDVRALEAFVHLVSLWPFDRFNAEMGMRFALLAMQQKCWPLAKACIPMVLDWSDEDRLWDELRKEIIAEPIYGACPVCMAPGHDAIILPGGEKVCPLQVRA